MDGSFEVSQVYNVQSTTVGSTVDTMSNNPINVYHVKEDEHIIGWIVLSMILALIIIILIILWVLSLLNTSNLPPCNCFGPFGVEVGVDANPINQCGTNRTTACIFAKNSISDCEIECNNLQSICQAFTFNETTSTMKIVIPTNTFVSSQANLFVRQSGTVS